MTTEYKKIITPSELRRKGETVTINRTTNAIRNHLQMLCGELGPVGDITIEITTVETLTDSAGSPLMTREADHG